MKIDARVPHLINTLLMSIWSLIGYMLLSAYAGQTDQVYVQFSGAVLIGLGVGGVLASISYVLQHWKKPRILEVRGPRLRKSDKRLLYFVVMILLWFCAYLGYMLVFRFMLEQVVTRTMGLAIIVVIISLTIVLTVFLVKARRRIASAQLSEASTTTTTTTMVVKPVSRGFALRTVSKSPMLSRFAKFLSQSLSQDVIRSGLTVSPYALSSRFLFYTLIALILSIPSAIILAILVHPALILVAAVPVVLLLFPRLRLLSLVGDRRRGAEDEIPFFTT
ncbi:MAG: hypothetical protein M1503_02380, partial [Thaumarchaeota archaeon]|nr:hypothetical protein [Nitrososphaerota archaeon]